MKQRTKEQNDEQLVKAIADTLFAIEHYMNEFAARKVAVEIVKKVRACGWVPKK